MNGLASVVPFDSLQRNTVARNNIKPFSLVSTKGKIIRAYSGALDPKQSTQYLLRCNRLASVATKPTVAFPNYTHQISIWYQFDSDFRSFNLLFRERFDFKMTNVDPDLIASEITDFLAYVMLKSQSVSQVLWHKQDSKLFWKKAIEKKMQRLQPELLAS